MITTRQVREIIRAHRPTATIYTNKTTGHQGPERRVKCYFRDDTELMAKLMAAAGSNNVYTTEYYGYGARPALIVKCVLG
jgi:hypothetical protein